MPDTAPASVTALVWAMASVWATGTAWVSTKETA
jgi:hypothetical protein